MHIKKKIYGKKCGKSFFFYIGPKSNNGHACNETLPTHCIPYLLFVLYTYVHEGTFVRKIIFTMRCPFLLRDMYPVYMLYIDMFMYTYTL